MALTALEIKNAKEGSHADGNGLYLQVTKSKTKSWLFRYTINDKRRKYGLGSLSSVTSIAARAKIPELKALVAQGIDPIEHFKEVAEKKKSAANAKTRTFMPVAKEYIEAHRSAWKSEKHAQQWLNTLATYVEPVFKDTPINEIGTELVLEALKPIWSTIPESASRIRGRIETVLNYAKGKNYRSGENPALWRGHLSMLLPANSKVKRTEHYPALPYTDLPEFMKELRERKGMGALALQYLILTVARSGSIRKAKSKELNLDKFMWDIPGEHMKGGKAFRLPLSHAAVEVVKATPKMAYTDLVFASPRKNSLLSDMSINKVIKSMNEERIKKGLPEWKDPKYNRRVVAHGFRSTFRDWGAELTTYSNEMLEVAMAHAVSDKTEAAYRRGDMLSKRQQLMEDWARYCAGATNVVPIKTAVGS
jgi:integrase